MESSARTTAVSKGSLWTGRVVSTIMVLFFLLDGIMKLIKPSFVVEGSAKLGFSAGTLVPMGLALLASTILYAIPRTSVLGAILLTGYLGGAVATHVRAGDPLFSHTFFPIYFGVLVWGALFLRDDRIRALIPLRRP